MRYTDLHALLDNSSSTRTYFLSLPVDLQLRLHQHMDQIHSAAELHHLAQLLERQPKSLTF